jgi:hypothetical protein
MAVPWLRVFDIVLGITNIAPKKSSPHVPTGEQNPLPSSGPLHLETRLFGLVISALKEAFNRDNQRLELEREQMEAERQRAERALRLELLRQAGDREIGRLRLLAGVAVSTWLGTLFFATRLASGTAGARAALGSGWLLLLGALAAAFTAQSRVASALGRIDDHTSARDGVTAGVGGAVALWLIVAGLGVIALAVLLN